VWNVCNNNCDESHEIVDGGNIQESVNSELFRKVNVSTTSSVVLCALICPHDECYFIE